MKRPDETSAARVLIHRLIPMIMITLAGAVNTTTDTVPSTTQATTTTPPSEISERGYFDTIWLAEITPSDASKLASTLYIFS